jgi:hypothetical protein
MTQRQSVDHHYTKLQEEQAKSVQAQYIKTSGDMETILTTIKESEQNLAERIEELSVGRLDMIDQNGRELNAVRRDINAFRHAAIAAIEQARKPFNDEILPRLRTACENICTNLETVNTHLNITESRELLQTVREHMNNLQDMSSDAFQEFIDKMPNELPLDSNHFATEAELKKLEQNWHFHQVERYHGYFRIKGPSYTLNNPNFFYMMVVDLQTPSSVVAHDMFFESYQYDPTTKLYSMPLRLPANSCKDLDAATRGGYASNTFADPLVRLTTKGLERREQQTAASAHPAAKFAEQVRREKFLQPRSDDFSVLTSFKTKEGDDEEVFEEPPAKQESWEIASPKMGSGTLTLRKSGEKRLPSAAAGSAAQARESAAAEIAAQARARSRSPLLGPRLGLPLPETGGDVQYVGKRSGRGRKASSGSRGSRGQAYFGEDSEKIRSRSGSLGSRHSLARDETTSKQASENSSDDEDKEEIDDVVRDETYEVTQDSEENSDSSADSNEGVKSDDQDTAKDTGKTVPISVTFLSDKDGCVIEGIDLPIMSTITIENEDYSIVFKKTQLQLNHKQIF